MLAILLAFFAVCPVGAEGNVIGVTSTSVLLHSTTLDADNKFHIAWDFDDHDITFEVSVETLGYVGLGFSPNGDMSGSDIVIGWVDDTTGVGHISDRHAVSRSQPLVDKKQDYNLLHSSQNGTHTVLRITRKLDLCSSDDHQIKDETVRVIWAYGEADPTTEGNIQYHMLKRGNKNIYLLNPQRVRPAMPENVVTIDFLNPRIEIPTQDTTYWCQSFPAPQLDQKHHLIKMEPVIQPGHEAELHHIILYACYHSVSNESLHQGHECYHRNMPTDFWGCTSVLLAWGVGEGDVYLPEHVGFPFGYDGDPYMLLLETHYDNPSGKAGLIDSSGLRVTLTTELREHDAGILEAGEIVGYSQIVPPHFERFTTSATCVSQCLSQGMESQPSGINVFANMLHTHLLGVAVRVRHFRNGIEQPLLAEDSNFDFDYQYTRIMDKSVRVLPGDDLVIECDYRTTHKENVTYGGLSTRDEMCLGFLMYYPKIDLGICQSTPSSTYLASFAGVELGPEMPNWKLYQDIEKLVDFNDKNVRERFQKWAAQEGVDGFRIGCSQGVHNYPVHGNLLPLPEKLVTLPPKTCGGVRPELTGIVIVACIMISRYL